MFWLWFVALCSFFVKGLCGFANSMVFTTLMSFSGSIVQISPIVLLLNYPSNLIMIWNGRKAIDYKVCLPLCAMVVLGIIPGTIFFKNADISLIEIIFGLFVTGISLDMLLRKKKPLQQGEKLGWKLGLLGILAGFVCGFCGIGVLVGVYISKVTDNLRSFKANACIVYFVADSIKIIMFACLGVLTMDILRQAVMLIPVAMLGLWLGMQSSKILNEAIAKKIVLIMLILSGLALVVNNL